MSDANAPPVELGAPATPYALAGLGALLLWGSYWGLVLAPKEAYMGDVQRIMYMSTSPPPGTLTCAFVYFSVEWWNSLHQTQSTPQTVSSAVTRCRTSWGSRTRGSRARMRSRVFSGCYFAATASAR